MTDEEQMMDHLTLLARAAYRIGKQEGAQVAREHIRRVIDALRMMDDTMEATLTGPRVQ